MNQMGIRVRMLNPEVTREDTSISLSTLLYLLLYSSMLKKPSSQSSYGNGKLAHWRTWITLLQTRKPMFYVASNLRLTSKSYLQAHKCKYRVEISICNSMNFQKPKRALEKSSKLRHSSWIFLTQEICSRCITKSLHQRS